MGIQTSAKLFYGVSLPDGTGREYDWEEQLYDLTEREVQTLGIAVEWAGSVSNGAHYLTAVRHDADLGEPATVILGVMDDAMCEGARRRLHRVWQALELPADGMPEPSWILAASAS